MVFVEDVYKKFNLIAGFFARVGKYVYAVNGVSFVINNNETYGLVGESGCGKTTVARLIIQMYAHDSGIIKFTDMQNNNYEIGKLKNDDLKLLRSKIKYIFQDPAKSLNPRMNILDILTAGYKYSPNYKGKKEALEEAKNILTEVGISPDDLYRRSGDFSGGQRQRISIARALITKPELLICDEVVSALDVSIQSQILKLLLKIKNQHKLSILFISHDLTVVSYLCDRIGVMYAGMLVEEAPSIELTGNRLHPYTELLYSSMPVINKTVSKKDDTVYKGLPDPTKEYPGCPFYDRCPIHKDICKIEKPLLREITKNHKVACHCVG